MSDRADSWDAFWNTSARVRVDQAARSPRVARVGELDLAELDRAIRVCEHAMRDLRASTSKIQAILGQELGARQVENLLGAVKQCTHAHRAFKAEWRVLKPRD